MATVFDRLAVQSLRSSKASPQAAKHHQEEADRWRKSLTSQCLLSSLTPLPTDTVTVPSLSSISMHRKHSKTTAQPPPAVRPVSYVLKDGTTLTEYFYVTDSVEPSPFPHAAPIKAPATSRRCHRHPLPQHPVPLPRSSRRRRPPLPEEKLDAEAIEMISSTGVCWENYGYPTSMSFIM